MNAAEIHEFLRERVDDEAIVAFDAERPQPAIQVHPDHLVEVALVLRDEDALDFDRLLLVAGVDWEGYDEKGKGKHRAIAKYGEDGKPADPGPEGTGDLGVTYHLHSMRHRHEITLTVRLPRTDPKVPSLGSVWPTAAWAERETFDFYGIEFTGHGDLRRLFLPEDWEGHPLRKDYAMPARYHDVPLEGLPLAVREEQEVQE